MSFEIKNLAPVNAPFNGNSKVFTYSSSDTLTTSGYFNAAYQKLNVGDVLVGCDTSAGTCTVYGVTASSISGVTISS